MLGNWQNWCRLCAKIDPENGDGAIKTESIRDQLEIVNKHFMISLLPLEQDPSTICDDCNSFLAKLEHFSDSCLKADQMFRELMLGEHISQSDLESIRFKYGVDNAEIKYSTLLPETQIIKTPKDDSESDHCPDPLDGEIERSESSIEIKEEMIEEKPTPIPRKRGRPRKKQEVFKDESNDDESEILEARTKPKRTRREVIVKDRAERWRGPRSSREKPSVCDICSKTYSRKYLLTLHMRQKHSDEELPYVCSKCPKRFVTEKRLQVHETTHLPDKERLIHPCPYCEKKFSTVGGTQGHIRAVHIGDKPFICEECGKSFTTKGALKEHQISHTEERSFQCSFCPKKYKNQSRLKAHEDVHNNTTYECPHCGVKRNTKRNLRLHMLVHSNVKKYKCNYCGNEYKRGKALKEHIFLHTGQRPYECPFCDKTFASGANCRGHKKKAHPQELAALEASGEEPKPAVLPRLEHLQSRLILPNEQT